MNIYEPIEVTTHNIYFHENSPIVSADNYRNILVTSGYDNYVRLWQIGTNILALEKNAYKTASNSSIKISFLKEFDGFNRIINCVRFFKSELNTNAMADSTKLQMDSESDKKLFLIKQKATKLEDSESSDIDCSFLDDIILAACSDGGKIIVYFRGFKNVIREMDGDNAYDLCWVNKTKVLIGFGSGHVEMYELVYPHSGPVKSKMIQKQQIHRDAIQGISYNTKHSCFATHSLDKTVKVSLIQNNEFVLISEFDQKIDTSLGVYRRLCFDENRLYIISKANTVRVYCYPFRNENLYKKIGPLNSPVIKIIDQDGFLTIATKRSVYILKDDKLVVGIDNAAFLELTDMFMWYDTVFYSSMDGFLGSIRMSSISVVK